jgi:hypothetical protein
MALCVLLIHVGMGGILLLNGVTDELVEVATAEQC